ncbi:MAG: MOSC domain-containing protein [Alphaproteobacteria bacterium]|nr:MOSC domain-containing protein [Alphaproteobacteria bacterium]
MTITIAQMYRYPVKGLSPEPLGRVELTPGRCLPQDRRFAIALPTTRFDPEQPQWLAKTHFIMLMRDEKLAELTTRFDGEADLLTIERDGRTVLRESLGDAEGRRRVAGFFDEFLAGLVEGPLRVVAAPGHTFADARRRPNASTGQYVSLINLASIDALEQSIGAKVAAVRFRANVYFAGAPAWTELDWLEREIAAGEARLRVVSPITRCAATQVNPVTAARDLDIVGALQRGFGHNLMGVYAEVLEGGDIALGDTLIPSPA